MNFNMDRILACGPSAACLDPAEPRAAAVRARPDAALRHGAPAGLAARLAPPSPRLSITRFVEHG